MPKPTDRAYARHTREAVALLGALIRMGRVERKLTAAELATRAGISRALLQRIEQGDPGCSIGAAFEAATIAGVSLFSADQAGLGSLLSSARDRISLLPKRVDTTKGALKDEF
jgi:transcriptional regulator with XRE-family HTH domain